MHGPHKYNAGRLLSLMTHQQVFVNHKIASSAVLNTKLALSVPPPALAERSNGHLKPCGQMPFGKYCCVVRIDIQNVSDQKDTACSKSANTKFTKQSILGKPPKVDETHALSKPVTSNLIPTPQGSKVMKNDKVIALGMFRINPFKPSREEKHVPNKVRSSVRTKSITVLQPPVITKKVVNSDSNVLSSTGVDNTKTRRAQPRSNTKNDRVPSASKSSQSKNKEVKVEEHHRKLLHSRNKKHMSSKSNNVKLTTENFKSKDVCAMCKQCLNSVNHNVCLLNYVNGMTSRGKKQMANVLINKKQKKQQPKLLINFVWKFLGTVRFRNDHVAAILGFGDLQWLNILITMVYFVEGLGQNLFSVGQFCDSDLKEIAQQTFTPSTSLNWPLHPQSVSWLVLHLPSHGYGINIYLTLILNTINDLAKNNLVFGLPKFKYHKEHHCPSCEQGKSKRASHPTKPIPNSWQRLHLLHIDLCGPMRIASINGKRLKPGLQSMTSRQISSGLDLTYAPSTITTQQPTEGELDLLFEAMYDDYIGGQPSAATRTIPAAQAHQVRLTPTTSTSRDTFQ
nr:retrovirus-related Pol polyprotein from transposon TNT 1-94 [Tanacetum cinerariifolium]